MAMIVPITEPPLLDTPPVKTGGDGLVVDTLGCGFIEVGGGTGTVPEGLTDGWPDGAELEEVEVEISTVVEWVFVVTEPVEVVVLVLVVVLELEVVLEQSPVIWGIGAPELGKGTTSDVPLLKLAGANPTWLFKRSYTTYADRRKVSPKM